LSTSIVRKWKNTHREWRFVLSLEVLTEEIGPDEKSVFSLGSQEALPGEKETRTQDGDSTPSKSLYSRIQLRAWILRGSKAKKGKVHQGSQNFPSEGGR